MMINHVTVHDYLCFRDAFDLQYGVCILRMREGLHVSHPSQSHGESFISVRVKRTLPARLFWDNEESAGNSCPHSSFIITWVTDLKWMQTVSFLVLISVNTAFDGEPESLNTFSSHSNIQTSTTCMYMHDHIIYVNAFVAFIYMWMRLT